MKKKLATCLGLLIVMVLALFGFAACGESLSLDAPQNVKYDGVAITWSKVENANGYIVTIGDKEYPVTTNRHAYIPTSADGTFTVSVKAYSDLIADKKSYSDPTEMSFRPLGVMGEITMSEEGVASWNIVEGASAYLLRYDGNDEKTVTTVTPSYSEFEEGAHQIQVRPIVEGDNTYYSKWSAAKSVNFLGAVKKESIQYADSRLQWGMVNGATGGYEVYINGQPYGDRVNTTYIDYESGGDTFQVSVKAIGDHTYSFDGKVSDQKSFVFLGSVTNIQVKDGILSWANISAATAGYVVKVENQERTVTTNEFDGLKAGSSRVSIKPKEYTAEDGSAQYFSDWSHELNITILPSPVITWDEKVGFEGGLNSIIWDGVDADGYTVRVTTPSGKQEEPATYPSTQRSFMHAYDEVGAYIVEVKATTSNQDGTVSDSKYSNAIKVVRLAAPKRTTLNHITSVPESVSAGFTVNYLPVDGADGYVLTQDGKQETLQNPRGTNSFKVNDLIGADETTAQEFAFGIMSKGHLVNSNNGTTVYLNSAEKLSFTITTLAVPANPEIDGYKLTYGEVAAANGYYVELNGKAEPSNSTTFDLKSRLQPGETPVSVCAAGNGGNVLASNYTPAINVLRLSAPYNIKIARSDNSEGSLSFDGPKDYTNNFKIFFENTEENYLVNEIENINRLIQTTNTPVHMTAEANFFDNNLKKYIMTSPDSETVTFIRLEAPTFGDKAFTNTQFIWNAPTNVNRGNFSPSYTIYNSETEQSYNGERNGTSYNIADWEGDCEYTLQVRALGNGSDIVDSELSVPRTIFKLATPEVMFGNGKYVWDSVPRTVTYSVYIDDALKATPTHMSGTDRYEFEPAYESPRADGYAVRVLAVGDGGATTVDSAPFAFKQVVKQLDRPDFTFAYSLEAYNATDGEIIVTISQESERNKGYQVIIGGNANKIAEGETELRFKGAQPGAVKISAYALGGNFGEAPEGSPIPVYYCNSTVVGDTSAYTLTILGKTNQEKIEISMDNVLSWATVTSAAGYEVELDVNGTKKTFTTTKVSDSTELKALLNEVGGNKGSRTVTVRVRAVAGNDPKKVTGEWVERIFQNI